MQEVDREEEDPETGLKRKVKGLEYKFEPEMEEVFTHYSLSFLILIYTTAL